jgi:hypothetical protein
VLAALVLAFLPNLTQGLLGPLDPWSKSSADGARVLSVDPEQRDGMGRARTVLRDADGHETWSRLLEYSLRDAEIGQKGEIVGWAVRTEPSATRRQMGLVVLDVGGKERSVEWITDSAGYYVSGIVLSPVEDRAIFRLDQFRGDVFTGREREEWQTLRVSTGERLRRFLPPVLDREGLAVLRRVLAVPSTPLLCCEAWFGSSGETLVELLDLEGRQVWSVALEEAGRVQHKSGTWRWSAERLSSGSAGEFTFQRLGPDELIRWRAVERPEAPGTWIVTEVSREPHAPRLEVDSDVVEPVGFTPKSVSEMRLASPCATGIWSDAAVDGQGRLLVLEAEGSHLHRFDAQGALVDTLLLAGASKAVDRILGVRADRFDLAIGDSFATWNGKGERLTLAYDRWQHGLPRPAAQSIEGARWFIESHEILRFAEDDPQAAITSRIVRHPDGTWFGDLDGGAVAPDGALITVDHPQTFAMMLSSGFSTVSRFDAQGNGKHQFRARLVSPRYLCARGRWLAGNDSIQAACFLADLDAQQLYSLGGEFKSWNYRVLLPPAEGEFWIVDLAGKRLLRAALPER